jgi:hypothetical protein
MRRFAMRLWTVLVGACIATAAVTHAAVPLDATNIVAAPNAPAPSQYSFTATAAQTLTLTLTDLKTPAAFTSLQVAVATGDTLVGSAVANSAGVATVSIPASAGTEYTVYVIGVPNSTQGIGFFGACVAPSSSASSCIAADSYSGSIATPSTVSASGTSSLNTNFTSTVAGTYTVVVTDDAFPLALQSIAGGIAQGSTPVTSLSSGTTTVSLAASTSYQLILAAVANSTWQAGLYGVVITAPTGAVVFDRTVPVGVLPAATMLNNPTSQALNLTLTDYAYPAALSELGVAVTQGGTAALASLTAAGTDSFTAPAGTLQVWQFAVAQSQPGVYGLSLDAAKSSLFSTTQVVNPASSSATSYAFIANLPAAGSYTLAVSDFQFPFPFQSLGTTTVAQNGTVLAQTSGGQFTAGAGPAVVLVSPTPPTSGDGIFDVSVETAGSSPTVVLDQTQAVGSAFTTSTLTLGTAGTFAVTLTDLGFPADFSYIAVVVSQGGTVLGKIYQGGTFNFTAAPTAASDNYVFTYIATPTTTSATASQNDYGLYGILVAPAVPTLTFSAGSSSVISGETVQLTWSSQNATTCTASGVSGWTGTEPTSGTLAVQIQSTSTLTLACSGGGTTVTKSVAVTATAAAKSSGGGGGVLGAGTLVMLSGIWLLPRLKRAYASRRPRGAGRVIQTSPFRRGACNQA